MYKKEFDPLLKDGFLEIKIWELDSFFLVPFEGNNQRKHLINRFRAFISEIESLNLEMEIWIDGSFTTKKPEPEDIDVVILLNKDDIDYLIEPKISIFEKLFMNREITKARYNIDAYFIDKNDPHEKNKWLATFGLDSTKMHSKGIYKLILSQNV